MSSDSKHWIEPGKFVERIVGPHLILTVDEIKKEKIEERTFTKGVKCHWVTADGIYQEGVFRTDELRPHIQFNKNVQDSNL